MTDEEFLREKIKTVYGLSATMIIFLCCVPLIFVFLLSAIFLYALSMFLGFLIGTITTLIIYAISWKNLFSPKLGDLRSAELLENINKYRKKVRPLIAPLIVGIILLILTVVINLSRLLGAPYYYVFTVITFFITIFSAFPLILGIMLKISLTEFHSEVDILEIDK